MPEAVYERLSEMKDWMCRNSPSVKGVERAPWPQKCNLPVTRRGNIWYIHVLAGDTGDIESVIVHDIPEPEQVSLLRDGKKLDFKYKKGILSFEVPQRERESSDEVVAVTLKYGIYGYKNEVFQFAE
jgi:alpha-L-fucosidase